MLPPYAGYKQELKRDFNLFTNSAISFSIISILTGITSERISLCRCRLPICCWPNCSFSRACPVVVAASTLLIWVLIAHTCIDRVRVARAA